MQQYGPIYTLWTSSTPTFVIGEPNVANEFWNKRSDKTSSRPRFAIVTDLVSKGNAILFLPNNLKWRRQRKALHNTMSITAVGKYKVVQEAESKRLVYNLLQSPDSFEALVDRYTASVVVLISYAKRIDDENNPLVVAMQGFMHQIEMMTQPGRHAAEFYPWLNYLPSFIARYKYKFEQFRNASYAFNRGLLDQIRADIDGGEAKESFASSSICRGGFKLTEAQAKYLLDHPEIGLGDRELTTLSASIFGAGVGTTSGTILSAILAMAVFPEAARKAQEELDRVVGPYRSPTWDDEQDLPYVGAFVKEALRWRPVAVLGGTPHATTEDDYFTLGDKTYYIPKDSTLLFNLWSINRDPNFYPDPDTFRPERFLDGSLANFPTKAGLFSFGGGRRICPGEPLARNSLFISLARLLWGFDVLPKTGSDGKRQDLRPATFQYTEGFNSRPKSFAVEWIVRSEAHRQTILQDREDAMEVMSAYEQASDPRQTM